MFIALLISAAVATPGSMPGGTIVNPATQSLPAAAVPLECKSNDPSEVLVCGRSNNRYRIDPAVLGAMRAREAAPPEPNRSAEAALTSPGCVGPVECGGDFLPLVAVALKTLEAATLAAKGEDWREAFRTHQDEYRLYQQSQERRARERQPKIAFGVSK